MFEFQGLPSTLIISVFPLELLCDSRVNKVLSYRFDNTSSDNWYIFNSSQTVLNSYKGGVTQEASSALVTTVSSYQYIPKP